MTFEHVCDRSRPFFVNRFFNIQGDSSIQLAPWVLKEMGKPLKTPIFRLEKSLYMRSDIAKGIIRVPLGYDSDLASIPGFAWSIFMRADDPRIELGAWVHDILYQLQGCFMVYPLSYAERFAKSFPRDDEHPQEPRNLTRDDCDKILAFEAMPDLLATPFQQSAVYRSLKYFGHRWAA